ncbi:Arylacetamide deacetylase [Durusdinium trenchii]|uniref:Arylacetamide deacetylase n=1 Tax=Durusdinium trenchii TaxID=1381693 RepID=A0ABP0RFY8_9DINO
MDSFSASPGIFFVHGGGFEWGGPREDGYDSLCSRLASGSGQIVVCCDHPLSGDRRPYKAPEILAALMKGLENPLVAGPRLRWVSRFDPVALERRTAPASLLLAGDSAGANQALSLLLQILSDDSLERELNIRGLVFLVVWGRVLLFSAAQLRSEVTKLEALISPWLDLSCGSHTYVSNAFAAEAHTGDVAFRAHADENRAGFKGHLTHGPFARSAPRVRSGLR